ncbi:hypothetical protein LTR53_002749 [Teratosphaeriaceae sp. CCFEE 6253]|nr:hypothetical protein LTR53_002749 [Teratosphaeriaceae sp. CCFEE 6253]
MGGSLMALVMGSEVDQLRIAYRDIGGRADDVAQELQYLGPGGESASHPGGAGVSSHPDGLTEEDVASASMQTNGLHHDESPASSVEDGRHWSLFDDLTAGRLPPEDTRVRPPPSGLEERGRSPLPKSPVETSRDRSGSRHDRRRPVPSLQETPAEYDERLRRQGLSLLQPDGSHLVHPALRPGFTLAHEPWRMPSNRTEGVLELPAHEVERMPARILSVPRRFRGRSRAPPPAQTRSGEPEYIEAMDGATGFIRREQNPRYDAEREVEAALVPAPLSPVRERPAPIRTDGIHAEERMRYPAPPAPAVLPMEHVASPPWQRQLSSTISSPTSTLVSPYDTRSSRSGAMFVSPATQAAENVEQTRVAAGESIRRALPALVTDRLNQMSSAGPSSPSSAARSSNENQPPPSAVSPTSHMPGSSSIAGTLSPGGRTDLSNIQSAPVTAAVQYPTLPPSSHMQGPLANASPVERLGSQDITAAIRGDSLRGSTSENVVRGRRRARDEGDEGDQGREGGSPQKSPRRRLEQGGGGSIGGDA